MPKSRVRKPKGQLVITQTGLDEMIARWEAARANQIAVINRLYGIIEFTRETANSPSLASDEKVELIKKRMP